MLHLLTRTILTTTVLAAALAIPTISHASGPAQTVPKPTKKAPIRTVTYSYGASVVTSVQESDCIESITAVEVDSLTQSAWYPHWTWNSCTNVEAPTEAIYSIVNPPDYQYTSDLSASTLTTTFVPCIPEGSKRPIKQIDVDIAWTGSGDTETIAYRDKLIVPDANTDKKVRIRFRDSYSNRAANVDGTIGDHTIDESQVEFASLYSTRNSVTTPRKANPIVLI